MGLPAKAARFNYAGLLIVQAASDCSGSIPSGLFGDNCSIFYQPCVETQIGQHKGREQPYAVEGDQIAKKNLLYLSRSRYGLWIPSAEKQS